MKIKNVEYRKQKSCTSIFTKTYKDFAENTSIHGLKYTVKNDVSAYEKLFWIAIVLCGLGGAIYMTMLFWERYTSNPTRTTIFTFAPTTAIPFPAITICNINRILVSKVDKFITELDLNEEESVLARTAIPQLLAFTNPTSIMYNITELEELHKLFERNGINNPFDVMKKVSQTCDEMLVKCFWNQKEEECLKLFSESLSTDGICCSFNYLSESEFKHGGVAIYTRKDVKIKNIPQIKLFFKERVCVVCGAFICSQNLVFVHTSQDFPGNEAIYKIISGQRISYLQLLGTELKCSEGVKSLPIEQRQCVYPHEAQPLYFHDSYADTNCLTECDAKHIYKVCKCVPFYFSFTGLPICNVTSIPCINFAMTDNNKQKLMECQCPAECEDYSYELRLTSANLVKTNSFVNNLISEDDFYPDHHIINICFLSHAQQVLLRDTITSTIYLLSSFGGVYSLFMGCSIMTIAELIYYFGVRFLLNMKIFGKIDNSEPDAHKNNKPKIINTVDGYYQKNIFLQ